MAKETATYISQLVATNPVASDSSPTDTESEATGLVATNWLIYVAVSFAITCLPLTHI